jgi:hypothetical protein
VIRDHDRRCRHLGGPLVAALFTVHCTLPEISSHQISDSRAGAYEAALATTRDGLVAAWYDIRDGNAEIYVRSLMGDGTTAGEEIRLTHDPKQSYEPSIDTLEDGSWVVAWYEKDDDGSLTGKVALWSAEGAHRWTNVLPGPGRNPVVAAAGQAIVVAWIHQGRDGTERVWMERWNDRGMAIVPTREIGPAHKTTWNLNLDVDGAGTAWLTYDAVVDTRANEVFLACVGARSASVRRLTTDDGHRSKYPDVAVRGTRIALTWYDSKDGNTEVYLFVGNLEELDQPLDARARRVTRTGGESIGAYLAWNGDRVGLAWSDDTAGQHEVYFQSFDSVGLPLAEPLRITTNRTSSLVPAIVSRLDGFALAWNEYNPGKEAHAGTSQIAVAVVP